MNQNWLTSTVFALCNGMRTRDDYSELPLLADALEEAGCDDAKLLDDFRHVGRLSHVMAQRQVCLILGGEYAESVAWLEQFTKTADCPYYEDTVSAAQGINTRAEEREDDFEIQGRIYDMSGYYRIENDGEYLHFGGRDAHSDIPPEFWEHVARVTGKDIPQSQRATSFSCSC